jgi:serine/threonine protein kinase
MSTAQLMLGEGAYAKVYGKNNSAVKITLIESMEDLASVAREQYVMRMYLPNMVPYRSCYYKWKSMHITMEKATCNLNGWLRAQKQVTFEKIRDIATQLLQGLYSLHEHNVMHRDLKPDNVLMKGDVVWICDFGLSRQFANDYGVATGYMVTRWYRAPEIWKKQKYTTKVDIWSLGCILHKIVYGKVPGKTLKAVEQRIPTLKNETDIDTLIRGLLSLDPEERWDAKRALAFLGEKPVHTFIAKPPHQTFVTSEVRLKWFKVFQRKFPKEYRILAYGLMMFDTSDQTAENMCCSMAISAMLFQTRPSKVLVYASRILKDLGKKPLETISTFLPDVCDGQQRLSDWETFDGSFDEYVTKMLGLNKKRKYFN